ncbi:MAG TPA: SAM-dependent methyltransferase [Actinophytocola sp.]|uniref:SAM-dependent methyltransferase n=1 Tax=Actinophytocola sp. TaxID=1872138 RepID=UPI002DDCFC64|nr:SAM-dependent methyltransferase [Actinophytocola sp.]HEV2784035.1 SAM-dependent methyltransferase [Actinophytocola sp.]
MRTELPGWAPADIDLQRPNAARVYDYLLGGASNFEVDRVFAHRLLERAPEAGVILRHNRAFLGRAVRFCVEQGIRQFLDLGSGIPTVGNVHEIAQRLAPGCRIVYVDNEPIAVAHSELMLEDNDDADVVLADLLKVDAVLGAEPVRRLIDFTRPMAVIMAAVLHFIPDEADPHGVVARYVDAMAPGSFLVLSHGADTGQERYQALRRMYDQSSTPAAVRTRERILTFMAGTELVEPGMVWAPHWRPETGTADPLAPAVICAAVGRKP